jgi:hypothetical protein
MSSAAIVGWAGTSATRASKRLDLSARMLTSCRLTQGTQLPSEALWNRCCSPTDPSNECLPEGRSRATRCRTPYDAVQEHEDVLTRWPARPNQTRVHSMEPQQRECHRSCNFEDGQIVPRKCFAGFDPIARWAGGKNNDSEHCSKVGAAYDDSNPEWIHERGRCLRFSQNASATKLSAPSSVAFSCAPQPARRIDRRTRPQRAPPHEQLNVDCSDR